ncbi:hypothetical protein B0H10DRAFT_1966696 [Mycena sp. CBHHK59/15]|nr:hypothetical protein B0H10DRAFT_1966696 [Mycena sp. CBHHK59/15]
MPKAASCQPRFERLGRRPYVLGGFHCDISIRTKRSGRRVCGGSGTDANCFVSARLLPWYDGPAFTINQGDGGQASTVGSGASVGTPPSCWNEPPDSGSLITASAVGLVTDAAWDSCTEWGMGAGWGASNGWGTSNGVGYAHFSEHPQKKHTAHRIWNALNDLFAKEERPSAFSADRH